MNRSNTPHSSRRLASVLVGTFVSLTLLVSPARAGGRKIKERDYKQRYDEILSVDQTAKTVTVATMVQEVPFGHPERAKSAQQEKATTYRVTGLSQIEVNGQKSDLKALSKGMKVSVTGGMEQDVLGRLSTK